MTILEVLSDPALFAPHFRGDTWRTWRVLLSAIFGLPLDPEQLDLYRRHTGRQTAPTSPTSEAWIIAGRRSGKSRMAAAIGVFLAAFHDYRRILAPGERAVVMILATDRDQAGVVFDYVAALIDETPLLAQRVESRTGDAIHLAGRMSIEVHTSSYRSVRGRTVVAAILDEVAFWRSDESVNPDFEVLTALRPATETVPGSLIIGISTPYARRGVLWQAHRDHFGKDGDAVVCWQSETRVMNPMVSQGTVDKALDADESAARAEWFAEFRRDVEGYVSREVVEQCVVSGCYERAPSEKIEYRAFIDPASGNAGGGSRADSMTLAIAHSEQREGRESPVLVLDLVREVKPKFSSDDVSASFAQDCLRYRVTRPLSDRWEAASWRLRSSGLESRSSSRRVRRATSIGTSYRY